ncbi:hypothetical protein [Rhodococcus aetherivorans]|uniref:hypothetical protein n=1 Tax=Rhodococcus aetherivorans TaxID=191292 RepID=UPI002949295C|nr:hypothetical protein [Rhodococcus aetherivorans]MDV6296945.1 hypothetical protein [Rhodococcus aetherivorans]
MTAPIPTPLPNEPVAPELNPVTTTPTTVPIGTEPAQSSGSAADVFVSGAVIAAVVGAVINVALAQYKDRAEERARLRATFAEAFEVAMQYKEFPYAIRRRRADEPAAERVRLSEEMRAVQAKLSYYEVWTEGESEKVGAAYKTLVTNLRRVAGKACNEAWKAVPIQDDASMNISSSVIDLSELKSYEQVYIGAVRTHFKPFFRR